MRWRKEIDRALMELDLALQKRERDSGLQRNIEMRIRQTNRPYRYVHLYSIYLSILIILSSSSSSSLVFSLSLYRYKEKKKNL